MSKLFEKEKSNRDRLKTLVVDLMGIEENEITDNAHLVDDLGFDSLDCIEFVMGVEEAFDLEIPDDDAEKITTFGKAVEYVKKKTGKE